MIRFNLSHSKGYAILAIAYGREVGVDVEVLRPKPKAAALVERFFSLNEKAAFRKLAPHEKEVAFFAGWTRKEAYLKAMSLGLIDELPSIEVTIDPGLKPKIVSIPTSLGCPDEWAIHHLPLPAGFVGAVVVHNR